ncbi:dihydropteroate synthase, partial [Streptomyces sp. NPDC059374]|uniref:dihydropteroate synthase n=1 Tax=Streptomyces sp. NPDC059374 TaxID=3346814 RepID=UPI0036B21ABF
MSKQSGRGRVAGLPQWDRCAVMGVVNVTPDSFSDGGRWFDTTSAVKHGLALVEEGADLVDVGGESTRPGATRVDEDEELRRVIPVVGAGGPGAGAGHARPTTARPAQPRRAPPPPRP